jgi:hypothetical protein
MMLMTYRYTNPLVYYVKEQFNFLLQKQKNYIKEGKRQITDNSNSLAFSRESDFRRRYLKEEHVIFITYVVMRLRYFTALTGFHGSRERMYIHICTYIHICYISVIKVTITREASLIF